MPIPTSIFAVPTSAIALFNEAKQAAGTNPNLDISQLGFVFSSPQQRPAELASKRKIANRRSGAESPKKRAA